MENKILLLIVIIFMHLVADFMMQGDLLINLKQKSFWEKNYPAKKYKNDYIVALFVHSFMWSFCIMLPSYIFLYIGGNTKIELLLVLFVSNIIMHGEIDHSKANLFKLNLIQDQIWHIMQILITWSLVII